MSLSTYSALQTSVANWLGRVSDADIVSVAPDLIALFEATANRKLRVRQQETSTTLTTTSGSATLPTDYLAWRSVTWEGNTSVQLLYQDPVTLRTHFTSSDQDTPKWFTIEGSTFTAKPVDDTTAITFRYYQKIPVLSDSNTSNWLLAAHPDIYLFGALVEGNAFCKDAQAAVLWLQRRDEIFAEIIALSNNSKAGGQVRPDGPTP